MHGVVIRVLKVHLKLLCSNIFQVVVFKQAYLGMIGGCLNSRNESSILNFSFKGRANSDDHSKIVVHGVMCAVEILVIAANLIGEMSLLLQEIISLHASDQTMCVV